MPIMIVRAGLDRPALNAEIAALTAATLALIVSLIFFNHPASAHAFDFFFSSRRRHTMYIGDWSSDVCSSDLLLREAEAKSRVVVLLTDGQNNTGEIQPLQ